jgi:hypothetical protein
MAAAVLPTDEIHDIPPHLEHPSQFLAELLPFLAS